MILNSKKLFTFFLAVVIFGVSSSPAQDFLAQTRPVALSALETLKKLYTPAEIRAMGIESQEALDVSRLGSPLGISMVNVKYLREYTTDSDPNKLLRPIERVVYPVFSHRTLYSAITIENEGDTWKATGYGGENLARLLDNARNVSISASHLSLTNYFAINAISYYFIGYRVANRLFMTPILNDPQLGFSTNEPIRAEEAFQKLIPIAKSLNTNAPM